MQKAVSKVFQEYSVLFNGTYREESPDGVTWHDQGKLPLTAPTIKLGYEFPFCQLLVEIDDRISPINEVHAEDQLYKHPERNLFEPRMDKLYLETKSRLDEARKKVMQNPDLLEKYPRLLVLTDILDATLIDRFDRFVTIQVDVKEGDGYISQLEDQIAKMFGVSHSSKKRSYKLIHLKDGVQITFASTCLGMPIGSQIYIYSPVSDNKKEFEYNKERFEEIKKFFLKHELLKNKNPHIDYKNCHFFGNNWLISFQGRCGYPILEEMFRKDIVKLKKS